MFSNCTDETHAECQSPAEVSAAQTADGTSQVLESPAPLGPALPEQIELTGSVIPPNALTNWGHHHRLRLFGWANGGYTGSSTGNGLLAVEPRPNRFGDEWVLNQAALVLERTLHEAWSWGFRAEFYMGADPALLHPLDGLGPSDNPRFSTDFRQAYFSFHAPILTEGGIDIKLGRQYTPLGYETTTSPYRPIYSEAYAFAYSQNGAATGAIATIHVDSKLDVIAGVALGANSLFDFRGRAPSYIARGLYFADSNKSTKLVGTLYTGPQPILAAAGHVGKWQTEVEVQLIHDVNRRLTLVSETNFGWDSRDPANQFRTSTWVGTYAVAIIHAHRLLDVNSRAEWFGDRNGSRIGKPADYGEITLGVNVMPKRSVNFRPEVRWDGADTRVFGPASASLLQNHQWTYALEMLVKF
jgi:Putative beta-barrel porin-2, OmpL-like. bbp2